MGSSERIDIRFLLGALSKPATLLDEIYFYAILGGDKDIFCKIIDTNGYESRCPSTVKPSKMGCS